MALFVKVICVFFVSFSLPAVPQKTGPTKRPVIFNIKYSTHDLKFGKNLEQVILQLKGKKINPNTAKKLHKSSLNSTAFKDFAPQAKRILGITKIKKSLSRFHQYCPIPSSQKNNPHPLYKKLNKGIDGNCRHIFINLMLKIKNKSNMNGKTLDYFKHALVFYLKSKNIRPLARYFKMVSSDSTLHRLISHYITDIYIKNRIKPHKRILSHMHINEKLTHHIQEVGLNDKKAHKYFVRELKKIVEQFKKMIVKEKYDEAQTFVDFALSFYDQNKRYIPQTLAWKIFLFAGKDFLYSKRRKKSVELFDYSLKLANNEDQRNESYFHLIWPHILDNDYKKAVKTIKKYKMMEKIPTFDSKIQFWMAYSLEQIGERQISRQLFNRLINNYPLHFYSIIALRRLERIDPVEAKKKIDENFYSPPSLDFLGIDNYTPLVINSIKRVLVWIELKQSRFLTHEIKNTIRTKKTDGLKDKVVQGKLSDGEFKKQLTMNITYLLTKKKKYLQTFKLLHGSLDGKKFRN